MRWTLVSLALDECLKCHTVHRVASVEQLLRLPVAHVLSVPVHRTVVLR